VNSPDYTEPAKQVYLYRRLRGHPWLADAAPALLLFGGSASAYGRQTAVIPVAGSLACAVAVRRRFSVAALAAALTIGTRRLIGRYLPHLPDTADRRPTSAISLHGNTRC
jgi:hypothetical protein